MKERITTYSELPDLAIAFICSVANIKNIYELTITQINDLLFDLDEYYQKYHLHVEDFLS